MFERPYAQAEPAILDEDQSAVVRREIGGMLSALHHLSQSLAPGQPVDRNLVYNILYVSESRLTQVGTITGVETNSAAEQERRHADLRKANMRVRELENQIGQADSAEQTKHAVAFLSKKVQAWWRRSGLGHVRDVTFDSWGNMRVALSCTLFGPDSLMDSDTPVSDQVRREAWLASLETAGFVLAAGRGRTGDVVACDASREALECLVKGAIPSATFHRASTRTGRDSVMVYSEVTFFVENLDDVKALPVDVNY
jgi:hypothetical protein